MHEYDMNGSEMGIDTNTDITPEVDNDIAGNDGIDLNAEGREDTLETAEETVDNHAGDDLNDTAQLDSVLDGFQDNKWSSMELAEQKQCMTDLAHYVANETGNKNPPEIVFRGDMNDGEYGGYDPSTNTLEINENMLDDSSEAADTVAHEMWHAHQQQCASDPSNERSQEYQDAFDNYVSPEYDYEGYQNQMVESEAREYAQGFKDRLGNMKGNI